MSIFDPVGIFSRERRVAEDVYHTERPWWWPEPRGGREVVAEFVPVGQWEGEERRRRDSELIMLLLNMLAGGGRLVGEPPPANAAMRVGQNGDMPLGWFVALSNIGRNWR